MHIHSYQIRNVLNVYRQQLSRGTKRNMSGNPGGNKAAQDRIDISGHGQRQTLFEKISSEIVQRITQVGPDTEIITAFSGQLADARERVRDRVRDNDDTSGGKGLEFSYTLIDKDNKKSTHNFSVRQLNYSSEKVKSLIATPSDSNFVSNSE